MNHTQFKAMLTALPPIRHSVPGQPFNIDNSDLVNFVMNQPGFKDWVWNRIVSTGRVEFDPATRMWHGVAKRDRKSKADSQEGGA